MYAPELIENRTFGPDALKVIGQAFEDAWAEIAGNFGEDAAHRIQSVHSKRAECF